METSIFLARLFGLYFVIIVAGMLINRSYFQRTIDNLVDSPAFIALQGGLALISGLLIVLLHNRWQLDWTFLITLLGYLALFQGVVRLWFPVQFIDVVRELRRGNIPNLITAIIGLIGFFLIYQGFSH